MAFPTTPVIDDFNRADEGPPPSSSWSAMLDQDANACQVVSNQCKAVGVAGAAYYNVKTYGPDAEAYCTDVDSLGAWLYVRLATPGVGTTDGYVIDFDASVNRIRFWRITNGANTVLGASVTPGTALAFDDVWGISIAGGTFTAWVNGQAIDTRTDTTYPAAGFVGLDISQTNKIVDDFGGGTIPYLPPVKPEFVYARRKAGRV